MVSLPSRWPAARVAACACWSTRWLRNERCSAYVIAPSATRPAALMTSSSAISRPCRERIDGSGRAGREVTGGAGGLVRAFEADAHATEPQLVPVADRGGGDALPVDERAVRAAVVEQADAMAVDEQRGVAARDGRVVDGDV